MSARKNPSSTIVANSLRDLKKIITQKKSARTGKNAAAKKAKPLDEAELFLHTMKEVEEIEEFRNIPVYHKTVRLPSKKRSSEKEVQDILGDIVKGRRRVNLSHTQEFVEWADQECPPEVTKDLHRGRYSVQDYLDLHGITAADAEMEIEQFIRNSVQLGYRCIKIIHGRGLRSPAGPVLKDIVVNRLARRHRKYVRAFVTARQCDGGLGALYVLLR